MPNTQTSKAGFGWLPDHGNPSKPNKSAISVAVEFVLKYSIR